MSEAAPPPPPARREFSLEELQRFVPGLGTIMPEIGNRCWKLYYAAKEGAWAMAEFQLAEINGLMRTGALTRPRYEDDLKGFAAETLGALKEPIQKKDFGAFDTAFKAMVDMANEYHEGVGRSYIVWTLPDMPPPDLDFSKEK